MNVKSLIDASPITSSVRNPDGIWINTDVFREEALHFKKYSYYSPELWGTNAWLNYWEEQLKRCKDGYEVGGVRITGNHYFYLNFTNIELVDYQLNELLPQDANKITESMFADKVTEFPHFWDGDFNYFWALEIARRGIIPKEGQTRLQGYEGLHLDVHINEENLEGGHHMIVGKSRRKGYSYKNAAIAANIFNHTRKSITVIGAYEKKYLYPEGTMGMATNYINWLNKYTGWAKAREFVDKQEHRKASYKEDKNGIALESGYQSQLIAVTFKDNPDAARGKDGKLIMFEEAGKFPNLRDAFRATEPSVTAGKYVTGQMVIYGTGGDMERDTVDFSYMFYNPVEFNLLPFTNIWDDNASNTSCGFFHPVDWNMEGYYDLQGNSDHKGAIDYELGKRKAIVESSGSSLSIQGRVQEFPIKPSEAFLTVSFNDFPIEELRNQLNVVIREKLYMKHGQAGTLYRDDKNKVRFKPDLNNELEPLYFRNNSTPNIRGAVVIYEYPIPNTPHGLYKIGHDPYRQQQAATSTSLGSLYVHKGFEKFSFTRDMIVAEYVGRPKTSDDYNRNMEMLAELYSAEIGYENEVTEVLSYFTRKKKLYLLAAQPDAVINANIIASKVKRIYGIHMVDKLKDAGEKYIKRWLLRERDFDDTGKKILNLHTIKSPGLLEELIFYNRKGNFDRCLKKDTNITTNYGVIPIQNVNISDMILTHDGTYKEVESIDSHIHIGNMVELDIMGEALSLIVTDNHPILIASTTKKKHSRRLQAFDNIEYTEANKLTNKYQFCLLPKRIITQRNEYSNELLYLIGWCLGDGYVNIRNNRVEITLHNSQELIADKLIIIIEEFIGKENNYVSKTNRTYISNQAYKQYEKGIVRVIKTSKKLTSLLLQCGCHPHDKFISKELYNTSNLMPLVIGYLEADGHQKFNHIGEYKRCNIEVATIYKNLLLQIRQILLDNGIWSSISNVKVRLGQEQLRLNIATNYINKLLTFYTSIKFKTCEFTGQKNNQIECKEGFWTPIKIKSIFESEEQVYNIGVKDNYTYVANNIVTHNCMSFMILMMFLEEEDEDKVFEPTVEIDTSEIVDFMSKIYSRN